MNNNLLQNILDMVENGASYFDIFNHLKPHHSFEIAEVLIELHESIRAELYRMFTDEQLADIISYIDPEIAADFFEEIPNKQIANIIEEMSSDDATDILINLDEKKRQSVINLLDSETRSDIETLAIYDEEEAGSIMSTNYLAIKSGNDVKDIMRAIVKEAPDVETIKTSFVIDDDGRLLGTLDLKKIIITKSPCAVDSIMDTNFHFSNVRDDKEESITTIQNYDIDVLPVLENGILKGIITGDDAMDTFVEEAEEDYARLGGLTDSEELSGPTKHSIKIRLPWLIILLIMNIFVALLISSFDFLLESLTILAFFSAVILDMAGNSGTQSLAITIQKITKGQLNEKKQILKHIGKETAHGAALGLIFGILAFFFCVAVLYITKNTEVGVYKLSFIVAVSIGSSLTVSNLSGSAIPVLFSRLKIDPAAASGPFITTVIDIIAILIYFSLAIALFNI